MVSKLAQIDICNQNHITYSYQSLKALVSNYISGEKVLVAGGSSKDDIVDLPSEFLVIYHQGLKVSSFTSTLVPAIPDNQLTGNFGKVCFVGAFAANCRGKLVVGHQTRLYEYNIRTRNWSKLPSTYKDRYGASSCNIGSKKFIICGGTRHGGSAEIFHFDEIDDPRSIHQPASLTYWAKFQKNEWEKLAISDNNNTNSEQNTPHWGCPSKLPVKVCYQTMIELQDGGIMMIGGCQVNGSPSSRVFIGHLTDDETDVAWKEAASMNNPRLEHIAFRLGSDIYVAGGIGAADTTSATCEKYCMIKNEWEIISFSLPYPLNGASVVVGKDETFALVIGGRINNKVVSNKVIVFTKEKGFSENRSFQLKSTRHGHVSLITE